MNGRIFDVRFQRVVVEIGRCGPYRNQRRRLVIALFVVLQFEFDRIVWFSGVIQFMDLFNCWLLFVRVRRKLFLYLALYGIGGCRAFEVCVQ